MFLKILAVTGIVLLCIAAFIVSVVLLVLLVPVRYKISADGKGSEIEASAAARWLFGLAGAKLEYKDSRAQYCVKVFSFTILKGVLGGEEKKEEEKKFEINIGEDEPDGEVWIGCDEGLGGETGPDAKKGCSDAKNKSECKNGSDNNSSTQKSLYEYIEIIIGRVLARAEKSKAKIRGIYKKIKAFLEKIKKAKYVWDAPVTKRALKSLKVKLFGLLNHIKPRKIKGEMDIGFEDPAKTAECYAVAAIAAGALGAELYITPDFGEKRFEVKNLLISGRIFIGYVVILALKLLTDKDVKRVVGYIRRNF